MDWLKRAGALVLVLAIGLTLYTSMWVVPILAAKGFFWLRMRLGAPALSYGLIFLSTAWMLLYATVVAPRIYKRRRP